MKLKDTAKLAKFSEGGFRFLRAPRILKASLLAASTMVLAGFSTTSLAGAPPGHPDAEPFIPGKYEQPATAPCSCDDHKPNASKPSAAQRQQASRRFKGDVNDLFAAVDRAGTGGDCNHGHQAPSQGHRHAPPAPPKSVYHHTHGDGRGSHWDYDADRDHPNYRGVRWPSEIVRNNDRVHGHHQHGYHNHGHGTHPHNHGTGGHHRGHHGHGHAGVSVGVGDPNHGSGAGVYVGTDGVGFRLRIGGR